MGRHDKPVAGRTPEGKRGVKPPKSQIRVQTSEGTWLWKQIAELFGSKKGKSK